jgi:hypothetical protein
MINSTETLAEALANGLLRFIAARSSAASHDTKRSLPKQPSSFLSASGLGDALSLRRAHGACYPSFDPDLSRGEKPHLRARRSSALYTRYQCAVVKQSARYANPADVAVTQVLVFFSAGPADVLRQRTRSAEGDAE